MAQPTSSIRAIRPLMQVVKSVMKHGGPIPKTAVGCDELITRIKQQNESWKLTSIEMKELADLGYARKPTNQKNYEDALRIQKARQSIIVLQHN
jgi:hypothetical protein